MDMKQRLIYIPQNAQKKERNCSLAYTGIHCAPSLDKGKQNWRGYFKGKGKACYSFLCTCHCLFDVYLQIYFINIFLMEKRWWIDVNRL